MDEYEWTRQHRRELAEQTMHVVDAATLEERFKQAFGSGSSAWTDWDERFVRIIENAPSGGLLAGDVGDDWHFVFSPAHSEGFWVLLCPQTRGKGLLQPSAIAALTEIARAKRLA